MRQIKIRRYLRVYVCHPTAERGAHTSAVLIKLVDIAGWADMAVTDCMSVMRCSVSCGSTITLPEKKTIGQKQSDTIVVPIVRLSSDAIVQWNYRPNSYRRLTTR